MYDVIIIGGGVTGLAAAMYAGRFRLKTLVLGENIGGTITWTDDVANYPGFKKITGSQLAKKIREHAEEYGIKIIEEKAEKVRKVRKCFEVKTKTKKFHSKTIIFATGTKERKLNIPGEEEFAKKGVHYCAICDGPLYRNKTIGVIGGSDSAAKEALLLSQYAKKIYIIYRGAKIRAEPINRDRIAKNRKIEIINNTNVLEIKGDKFLKSVILDRQYKGKREFKLDGIFIEIGRTPLSQLAKDIKVKLNKKGEIKVDRDSKTNTEGVFAAGDIVDTKFKQAITGASEGVVAAYNAYLYVSQNDFICTHSDE